MPYIAQWYCRAHSGSRLTCILFLVVLGQRGLRCVGKAPCCRQQDKASKRTILARWLLLSKLVARCFFSYYCVFWALESVEDFLDVLLSASLLSSLMLKRSSRGPTEMRGSWAHKGITARSRAKPVALEKGVRGGSDGGTRRNGWNEKKGFGAATIPCKDRVRQRREDMGERLPKWEVQRSESKK